VSTSCQPVANQVAAAAGQATAGSLQSLCWASSALGSVASAYFSGALVEAWGPRSVFGLTAVFPLVVSAAAALIDEQPAAPAKLKADEGQPGGRPLLVPGLQNTPKVRGQQPA